jgi:hypothetical protein
MAGEIRGRIERRRGRRRRRVLVVGAAVGSLVMAGAIAGVVMVVTRTEQPTAREVAPTTVVTVSTTTTTTAPVSTTIVPRSPDPVVALAQQYDGRYEGTWQNSTFGTSGPAVLTLRIDPAAQTMTVQADFDGDVFGGDTKEIRRIEAVVPLGDPTSAVSSRTKSFGAVTGRLDANLAVVLDAPDVPGGQVESFQLSGRLRADQTGFDATYHVEFENGETADGVMTVACSPTGQRTSEVPTICPAA